MTGRDIADSYQQVLTAISDALAIPTPPHAYRKEHRDLLVTRVAIVRGVISNLSRHPGEDPSHAVRSLAELVEDTPPTYPAHITGDAS